MFSQMNNSSKLAFIALNQHFKAVNGKLIDCQMQTEHLHSLGVNACSRAQFIEHLNHANDQPLTKDCWLKQPIRLNKRFNTD